MDVHITYIDDILPSSAHLGHRYYRVWIAFGLSALFLGSLVANSSMGPIVWSIDGLVTRLGISSEKGGGVVQVRKEGLK